MAAATAPKAHADQYDFVSQLDSEGVYYSSISDMIDLGKAACSGLRHGTSPWDIVAGLKLVGYAPMEAADIMTDASLSMCPDTWATIRAHANDHDTPPPAPPADNSPSQIA